MSNYLALYRDIASIDAAINLLQWDRQILMPRGGARPNVATIAHLIGIRSRMYRDSELLDSTQKALETAESPAQRRMAEVLLDKISREVKVPTALNERKSIVSAAAYGEWRTARPSSDFRAMAPHYRELIEIAREIASIIAVSDNPYDSLLDQYEPGARVEDADRMFATIEGPLVELRSATLEAQTAPNIDFLEHNWDETKLLSVARRIAAQVGFDFGRGRLDTGTNAFCASTNRFDIRMSARPNHHIRGILSSALHEVGHGLYEQNIAPEYQHTPLSGGISLAVHESQSRLWENMVGRHPAFWRAFFPVLTTSFPELSEYGPARFASQFARVNTSTIRVGSDELSYNLHILVRYQLEIALISGRLDVDDLPSAWNELYRHYMGTTPKNHAEGVLQDVHWSRGSFGYFPTYAMGNILGGQIWRKLTEELPLPSLIEAKEFGPILEWLTKNVYSHGQLYTSRELMTNICGSYMDAEPWLTYVTARFQNEYE